MLDVQDVDFQYAGKKSGLLSFEDDEEEAAFVVKKAPDAITKQSKSGGVGIGCYYFLTSVRCDGNVSDGYSLWVYGCPWSRWHFC